MAQQFTGYGMPSVDFSQIGKLGDVYNRSRLEGNRERTLAELGQGVPVAEVARKLAQAGDTEGYLSLARLAEAQAQHEFTRSQATENRAFRESQAAESRRQFDVGRTPTPFEREQFDEKRRQFDAGRTPTPTLTDIYDPTTGQPQKAIVHPGTGDFRPVGGVKREVPSGFEVSPAGGLGPQRGGPADPNYVKELTAAKEKLGADFKKEQELRKEVEAVAKPFMDVRRAYERVLASRDDAAGDISMIFGFMRMLDPQSVVREGEFATAQNAAGIPDRVRNIYNRALEGTRLTESQRKQFKGQSGELYKTASKEFEGRSTQFRGIATQHGLDPDRVLPSLGAEPKDTPAPPSGFQIVR